MAKRQSPFSAAERKRRFNQAMDEFLAEVLVLDYSHDHIQEQLTARLEKLQQQTAS